MSRTVLIVDDSPVQCRLVEAAALAAGWRALICTDGNAAFGVLTRPEGEKVDAVLLDLVMSEGGGLELLRRLRAAGVAVPVVVQTARSEIAVVVECMREGADDFLLKPSHPARILAALEEAVERAETAARTGDASAPSALPAAPLLPPAIMPEGPAPAPRALAPTVSPPLALEGEDEGLLSILSEDGEVRSMEEIEAEIIQRAMRRYGNRPAVVARRMGLGRSTLYRKLRAGRVGSET